MPVFNDETIMKALFGAIKEVEVKFKELYQLNAKNNAGLRDGMDKWENQNRNNTSANTK
jgi:hypothetical protein